MKKVACLIISFLFLGINSTYGASIEIKNYTPKQLKPVIIKHLISQNERIDNITDYSLRSVSNNNSFMTNLIYGSQFNVSTETRTYYTFVENGKNCIVSATAEIITNPNSGYEKSSRINEEKLVSYLDELKKSIEGYYGYGIQVKEHIKNYEVLYAVPNTEAFDKLNCGDRIYKINGKPVVELGYGNAKYYLTSQGEKETIVLTVKRGKKIYEDITLHSKFIKPTIDNN